MKLPQAPERYDRGDQDRLRAILEDALSRLETAPSGWTQPTGTASRATFDTASGTLTQALQALKAVIDDLVLKVKS